MKTGAHREASYSAMKTVFLRAEADALRYVLGIDEEET